MHGDIDTLITFIAQHFPFEAQKYKELTGRNEQENLAFAIRHLASHTTKAAGALAAVSERVDHGEALNTEELKQVVPKMFINTLRLAELAALTEADLIAAIEQKYKTSIQ